MGEGNGTGRWPGAAVAQPCTGLSTRNAPPLRRICSVDISALRFKVFGLPEADWMAETLRQERFEQHQSTQSIVLLFCKGWPDVEVEEKAGHELLYKATEPITGKILQHFPPGGRIIRAMFARLPPGGHIGRHFDNHPTFEVSHRIHVPIATNPGVRFTVEDEPVKMEIGGAYEINNLMHHEVVNEGDEARIHFIFDYMLPIR